MISHINFRSLRTIQRLFSSFCHGCGSKVQHSDPSAPGFIPSMHFQKNPIIRTPSVYESQIAQLSEAEKHEFGFDSPKVPQDKDPKTPVCQRCHSLQHHNSLPKDSAQSHFFTLNHLNFIQRKINSVILHVFDILDFPRSILCNLPQHVGGMNPIILVANKMDLLPKLYDEHQLRHRIRKYVASSGLWSLKTRVHLISAKRNMLVRELAADVRRHRVSENDNIYIVGRANSGKSELANAFMRLSRHPLDKITASWLPGTTVEKIGVPIYKFGDVLGGSEERRQNHSVGYVGPAKLYDTPGVEYAGWLNVLSAKELAQNIPNSPLKPVTFRLAQGLFALLIKKVNHYS